MAIKQMAYLGKGTDRLKCAILKQEIAEALMASDNYYGFVDQATGLIDILEESYLIETGDDIAQYYDLFPQNPVGGVDSIQKDLCSLENGNKLAFRLRSYDNSPSWRLYRTINTYFYFADSGQYGKMLDASLPTLQWCDTIYGRMYGRAYLGLAFDDVEKTAKLFFVSHTGLYDIDVPSFNCYVYDIAWNIDPHDMYHLFFSSSLPFVTDPWSSGGFSETGGGDGNLDLSSDTIDTSEGHVSFVDTGFIQIFCPDISEVRQLSRYLWQPTFLESLQQMFDDPMGVIISMSKIPFTISETGTREVEAGNVDTRIMMKYPLTQYVTLDFGTLHVDNFYNAYLDYEPYTKATLYLPYVGTNNISVDEIMGKDVNIKYTVDLMTGACVANVYIEGSIFYTFSGNCATQIPISAISYSNIINGIFDTALTAVSGGGFGASLASNIAGNVMSMKPTISRSGAVVSNLGELSPQKPFFTFTIPKVCLPKNQFKFTGYPALTTVKLSELFGYTKIESIFLNNFTGTENEKNELLSILKEGVIL